MRLPSEDRNRPTRVRKAGVALLIPGLCLSLVAGPRQAKAQENKAPAAPQTQMPQTQMPPEAPMIAQEPIDPTQPIKPSFVVNVSVVGEPGPSGNYGVDAAGNILLHVANV